MDVEIPARAGCVRPQQARLVGLVDGGLQALGLAEELAADIDVGGVCAHGEAGDERALYQFVRVVAHDLPVLARAGLALVRVDHQEMRLGTDLLGHEGPFEAGGEAGAAAPAQAGGLDLVDDSVPALGQDVLGAVPVAAPARAA